MRPRLLRNSTRLSDNLVRCSSRDGFIPRTSAWLRAQATMGGKVAVCKSYKDFFTVPKDADSGIPICNEAKAEYARLRCIGTVT